MVGKCVFVTSRNTTKVYHPAWSQGKMFTSSGRFMKNIPNIFRRTAEGEVAPDKAVEWKDVVRVRQAWYDFAISVWESEGGAVLN
jgi:hypothetical protein